MCCFFVFFALFFGGVLGFFMGGFSFFNWQRAGWEDGCLLLGNFCPFPQAAHIALQFSDLTEMGILRSPAKSLKRHNYLSHGLSVLKPVQHLSVCSCLALR